MRSKKQEIIATDSGHADMPNAKPPEFDLEQVPLGAHARPKAPVIEHEDADASHNHPAHAALSAQDRNFVVQHIAAEQIRDRKSTRLNSSHG